MAIITLRLTPVNSHPAGRPSACCYCGHSVEQSVAWLKPFVVELGIAVLVTDDLAEWAPVAEQLGVQQQVCQFHLIRWVERALREMHGALHAAWHGVVKRIRQLVRALPAMRCVKFLLSTCNCGMIDLCA